MTPTVTLRPLRVEDLPLMFEHQRDPVARRMVAFGTVDDDWPIFEAKWRARMGDDAVLNRTIEADGVAVGDIGHFMLLGEPSIGYWIGRAHWGRGIATEALRQFLPLVPTRPLYARVAHDNAASLRVLAHCGFQQTGTERGFSEHRGEEIEEIVLKLE